MTHMKNALSLIELSRVMRNALTYHHSGRGLLILVATLFLMSVLAGLEPSARHRLFVAGEVADTDVIAHRDLTVEDAEATKHQREKVAELQPTVFTLDTGVIKTLRDQVSAVLKLVNTGGTGQEEPEVAARSGAETAVSEAETVTPAVAETQPAPEEAEAKEAKEDEEADPDDDEAYASPQTSEAVLAAPLSENLLKQLSVHLGAPVSQSLAQQWAQPAVQSFILNRALPWFERQLSSGVVGDSRQILASKGGILIRDTDSDMEVLRHDAVDIPDLSLLLVQFSQLMRDDTRLDTPARRAVDRLFSLLVKPSMVVNREATLKLGAQMASSVKPVLYSIRKGELVVSRGEIVTRETQLKLQGLFGRSQEFLQLWYVGGLFLVSLLLCMGMFQAPSGKMGTPLREKDFLLIALLLVLTVILAKGAFLLFGRLMTPGMLSMSVYGFPLAGIAGLSSLMFAARRYCVVGILLSLFSVALFKANIPAFMFFYLSAMVNTWLILRSQTRQDVVRGVVPLFLAMAALAIGCGWMEGYRGAESTLMLVGFAAINAFLSLLILFAVSPLLEMLFHYTTRFRLMELMSMEQPLLQELMVTIPGTYHHSLVVSNMVEAGAKAVNANSLLCKVAALYHDVGKLARPEYFIENQFGGPNKHDKLAPAMSALILGSHVKKGTELAQKYHLGEEIEDIIRQHHGTSVMRFFYRKAQELGESPKVEDFSYPGPRPQTREAAIVMLADVVEASSRTLTDPTPARIRSHIDTIVKGIFADGQLDESELTFKDLHKLSDSFARILIGLFHQRIAYPEAKKNEKEGQNGAARAHEAKPVSAAATGAGTATVSGGTAEGTAKSAPAGGTGNNAQPAAPRAGSAAAAPATTATHASETGRGNPSAGKPAA